MTGTPLAMPIHINLARAFVAAFLAIISQDLGMNNEGAGSRQADPQETAKHDLSIRKQMGGTPKFGAKIGLILAHFWHSDVRVVGKAALKLRTGW
jgi:hypothetical protein